MRSGIGVDDNEKNGVIFTFLLAKHWQYHFSLSMVERNEFRTNQHVFLSEVYGTWKMGERFLVLGTCTCTSD